MPDPDRSPEQMATNAASMRNIFAWMKHAGIRQTQVAERLGVAESVVSRWKSGRLSPMLEDVVAICQMIGITLADAFSRMPGATSEDARQFAHDEEEIALLDLWRAMPSTAHGATMAWLQVTYGSGSRQDPA